MPFLSDFELKNNSSHAHFLSKKLSFPKKTQCSHAHIYSKKRQFSQNHCSLMSFFQIFHEKPKAVMPIFGEKKTSIFSTLHYVMGKKSQWDAPFFSDF